MRFKNRIKQKRKSALNIRTIFRLTICLFILSVALGVVFYKDTLISEAIKSTEKYSNKLGFVLHTISLDVSGNQCIDFQQDSYITRQENKPMILLPMDHINRYIRKIDCVEDASIRRIMPDKLYISIKTKKPIAIWQNNKRFYFITSDGSIMNIRKLEGLEQFIIITGENAPNQVPNLIDIVSIEPEIHSKITSATWVGNRRWNIKFENDTELMLPENNAELAWHKFIDTYKTRSEFQNWKYKKIDMRVDDKIYAH